MPRRSDGAPRPEAAVTDVFSRAATVEDLKVLLRSLNDRGAEYILIGGYALHAHGYQRATTDIDLLVPQTREAGMRIREALLVLPDRAAKDIDPAWFEEGDNIRVADAFVARGSAFEYLSGTALRTCSAEDRVVMKAFAGRERDFLDIEGVTVRQGASLNWTLIEEELKPCWR